MLIIEAVKHGEISSIQAISLNIRSINNKEVVSESSIKLIEDFIDSGKWKALDYKVPEEVRISLMDFRLCIPPRTVPLKGSKASSSQQKEKVIVRQIEGYRRKFNYRNSTPDNMEVKNFEGSVSIGED